jgi:hypothetical protein
VAAHAGSSSSTSDRAAAAADVEGALEIASQPRALLEGLVDVQSDLLLPAAWLPTNCSLEEYADSKRRCGLFRRDSDHRLRVSQL